MGPKTPSDRPQDDLFRQRLDNLIALNHELVRLSELIDWIAIDHEFQGLFASPTGAPAKPSRLVAGLLYLKHVHGLSDEALVAQWVENPYWQYFCGETWFQHEPPVDPSSLTRWRQRLGEEACERLLMETIQAGQRGKVIKRASLKKVVVDTTVQEKHIAFPTDAKLLDRSRIKLIKLSQRHGLSLRQNYNRVAQRWVLRIGRYAHAKQYKRMRRTLKKLNHRVGRVVRDIERQLATRPEDVRQAFEEALAQARQIMHQTRHPKSKNKLYSLHAPEVDCISKGKAHKRYEFGVKVSVAVSLHEGFVLGARSYPGNPYDGHTLYDQLQQVETLTGIRPERAYVDRGYHGHGVTDTKVYISGQRRGVTAQIKRELKRRSAVEPEIGHMKQDGLLGRSYLKGEQGDAINALLAACGHNLRKILNALRALWRWMFWAGYAFEARQTGMAAGIVV